MTSKPESLKAIKENDLYLTPPEIWRGILSFVQKKSFDCDPCSPIQVYSYSVPAKTRYTELDNGLTKSWGVHGSHTLLNPPYSQYDVWVKKAIQEAQKGVYVWAILNQSNANIWQDEINPEMQFKVALRKRIKFYLNGVPQAHPRYDNYIVHFGPDWKYGAKLMKAPHLFPLEGEMIAETVPVGIQSANRNLEFGNESVA